MSRAHPRRSTARRTSSSSGKGCPSRGSQAGMTVQFAGPVPTPHGALGGRKAFAGCGPAIGAFVSAQPSEGCTKAWWSNLDTTSW